MSKIIYPIFESTNSKFSKNVIGFNGENTSLTTEHIYINKNIFN